jgi:uncharacterized protein (TIGR02284 family)
MLVSDLKPLALLNGLIGLNNDRVSGYENAGKKVKARVLKDLFWRLAETSSLCREELVREVHKLGGIPQPNGSTDESLRLAWDFVYRSLDREDHRVLLNSCYVAEEMSVRRYEEAMLLEDEAINTVHQKIFCRQHDLLAEDNYRVKNLLSVISMQ